VKAPYTVQRLVVTPTALHYFSTVLPWEKGSVHAGRGASSEWTRGREYTRQHSLANTSPRSPEILQNNEMREFNPLGDALE